MSDKIVVTPAESSVQVEEQLKDIVAIPQDTTVAIDALQEAVVEVDNQVFVLEQIEDTQIVVLEGGGSVAAGAGGVFGVITLQEVADPGLANPDEAFFHAEDVAGFTQLHYNSSASKWTLAQDQWVVVRNTTGSVIPAGSVVTVNGATGQRPTVRLADAGIDHSVLGLAHADIANNGWGEVVVHGYCRNKDTSAFSEGQELYLSTTPGAYTTTKPDRPAFSIEIGVVVYSHATNGIILVKQHEHITPIETISVPKTAGGSIGGHRAVVLDAAGKAIYADNTNLAHRDKVLGVTLNAAVLDAPIQIQTYGEITEPSWTWTLDDPVFLSTTGLLTQTPPVSGFLLKVGFPTAATKLFVDIGVAITL